MSWISWSGAGYTGGTGISGGEWLTIEKEGIDVDIAQYISSLIPQERGFYGRLVMLFMVMKKTANRFKLLLSKSVSWPIGYYY